MTVLATFRTTIPIEAEPYTEVAALVRRAQVGDREALGRLVEQFQSTVHAICLRRLGHPSEALELTQEVFLHVMRRIDQLREPERFAGWLRQVAVRMAINRATRRTPPPSVETGVLEGAAGVHDDPLDELISRERAGRLYEGLARLKTLDRETLVAFYLHGQSLVEMAERLDAPVGTIKRRLHTARKRLKAELQAGAADADEWTDGEPDNEDVTDTDDLDGSHELPLVGAGSGRSARW
jgi:RNA polymerase sigma-70 factor (ECF subfamily)